MILKVTGNSMWPLLENGDEISISKEGNIKKGDIITVHNAFGRILTHRVIDEVNLITKGDNNVFPEKPLINSSYEFLGKLNYVLRNGERIYINDYNQMFYKYSSFESKIYKKLFKIIQKKNVIYTIKQLTYSIFVVFFKLFLWKRS